MSGSAGDVVQARDVHGGVHFHGPTTPAAETPRQLPADVYGFVNRQRELDILDALFDSDPDRLPATGVFVIAGTAGVGKTSLAIHWAHRVLDRFPDGQLCINLRGYDPGAPVTAAEALDRILRALNIAPSAIPTDVEDRAALYRSRLAERRMLLLLDNAATARQVRPLLPGASRCLVLITSRSRLSGLAVRDGAQRITVDVLPETDAVTLLHNLTSAYRSNEDPAQIAELARLCARLPLALRIAAERAASRPQMPIADLIRDLRDEYALWDALTAEDDDESDAVRTVFAWSYRALPESAARLFRLLGLHPGPQFSTLAAAVLAGDTLAATRHALDVLAGAHRSTRSHPTDSSSTTYCLRMPWTKYAKTPSPTESDAPPAHSLVRARGERGRRTDWSARPQGPAPSPRSEAAPARLRHRAFGSRMAGHRARQPARRDPSCRSRFRPARTGVATRSRHARLLHAP